MRVDLSLRERWRVACSTAQGGARRASQKKERGQSPARKIVSTLFTPNVEICSCFDGVTLLVRAGLLPRLGPPNVNLAAGLSRTRSRCISSCQHFRQLLFKIQSICEVVVMSPFSLA